MGPFQNDENLARLLLGRLCVAPRASPDFRAAVWGRIESLRTEQSRWAGWLRLHRTPVASATLVSLALFVGIGSWAAGLQELQMQERLVPQYVSSIDHGIRTVREAGP